MTQTLKTGDLAFYDSITGLIPCKVLSIVGPSGPPSSTQNVTFKLTANRRAFKRGETLSSWALHVVPRKSIAGRYRNDRIRFYNVQSDS